jgi:hypothetical protein
MKDESTKELPEPERASELMRRRDFLVGLGTWSAAVIGGILALTGVETASAQGAWVNRRGAGGGGGWVNGAGGGGGWVNRSGGGWVNGGGAWANRAGGGGGWVNGGGGGGGWVNRRGAGGAWVNR